MAQPFPRRLWGAFSMVVCVILLLMGHLILLNGGSRRVYMVDHKSFNSANSDYKNYDDDQVGYLDAKQNEDDDVEFDGESSQMMSHEEYDGERIPRDDSRPAADGARRDDSRPDADGALDDRRPAADDKPLTQQLSWQERRRVLLSKNGPRKVYMFAYMRGGSSVGGELFNSDPKAVLWYEPLEPYYMAYYGAGRYGLPISYTMYSNLSQRVFHQEENQWYLDYFRDIFTCNYDHLPPEALSHTGFLSRSKALKPTASCTGGMLWGCKYPIRNHCGSSARNVRDIALSWRNRCPNIIQMMKTLNPSQFTPELKQTISSNLNITDVDLDLYFKHFKCMQGIKTKMAPCLSKAIAMCKKRNIHTVEVIRANMKDLEILLEEIPDMYVMYYVRDPRAVASSALRTQYLHSNRTVKSLFAEVKYVCSKMALDMAAYHRLNEKYPGAFLLIKYEDLVLDNLKFGDTVYAHLGLGKGTAQWADFSNNALHSTKKTGQFGVQRADGTASIAKWRSGVNSKEVAAINAYCKDVLEELNYPM